LSNPFVYPNFRQAMTPEIARALAVERKNLSSDAANNARMLLISQKKDPVGEWIKLLEDRAWPDKATVAWELAALEDSRALQPLVGCLRRARESCLTPDPPAIERCLEAVAAIGGDEAIRELIGLLTVSFGRAKNDYLNDKGLHRIIAAHLIELTGESFGVDAKAWRKWFEAGKPRSN